MLRGQARGTGSPFCHIVVLAIARAWLESGPLFECVTRVRPNELGV